MNKTEAKHVLMAFRSGTSDRNDPDIAQALAWAERDAELGEWLRAQQAFHESVRRELRSVPIPTGLKDRILRERIVVPLWRRREVLLAAACLVAALTLSVLLFDGGKEDLSFAGFRARMVGFALREYRMDIETTNSVQVGRFLQQRGVVASIPTALQTAPVLGGARLSWQNKPVGMVCFGTSKQNMMFMFVVDQAALRSGRLPDAAPSFDSVRGLTTASWTEGKKVYLVASEDASLLRGLLRPRGQVKLGSLCAVIGFGPAVQ